MRFGPSLTYLGHGCFINLGSGIKEIYVPNNVQYIGKDPFIFSYVEKLVLPFVGSSRTATTGRETQLGWLFEYEDVSGWGWVSGRNYYCINQYYDGYVYIPSTLKQVIVTDCDRIENYAFRNCSSIESIILPNGANYQTTNTLGTDSVLIPTAADFDSTLVMNSALAKIGNNAFEGCTGLKSIVIPATVTEIGANAFYGCTALTSAILNNDIMGSNMFQECTKLSNVVIDYVMYDLMCNKNVNM